MESEAVRLILDLCSKGVHQWVSSTAVEEEVDRNPEADERDIVQDMLAFADERLLVNDSIIEAAHSYKAQGIKWLDAMHLALAECCGCDILFTVDDDFLHRAGALTLRVKVENPATWVLKSGGQ